MAKTLALKFRLLSCTASAAGIFFVHGAAYAQAAETNPNPQTQAASKKPDEAAIVVTGTLFRNPEITQSSPVTVIGAEEIQLRQTNTAEELLRTLPGVVPNIGQFVNNGNLGASFVNLRGLGPNRNLVLLDGARVAPADLSGAVDLNNIPLALVQRIDILTGGASATYGADAVTGVVNFITRNDFHGVEASASSQITKYGDGAVNRAEVTMGVNAPDGRGNVVFSLGFINSDAVIQSARSFAVTSIDSFSGQPGGFSGTTVPARFTGARNPQNTANATLQIDPTSGALVPTFQLFNFNAQNAFQTPFKRINLYSAARFNVTDDVEVYGQGLFSKNKVRTVLASTGTFGAAVNIPLNNPFLPAIARQQFCAFDTNPDPNIYTPRFTPAECAAAALATGPDDPRFRTVRSAVFRRFVESGPRLTEFDTRWFNFRGGVRGNLTSTLHYDVYGSYGDSQNISHLFEVATLTRLQQALLATSPTTCLDSSNGCVPIDLFGPAGSISQDQLGFLLGQSATGSILTSLSQARALLSGDFGLTSPWAGKPVSIAAGVEYRRYVASIKSDALTQTPGEILGGASAQPDVSGSYDVKEAFGELIAPVVEQRPFMKSLQLELGGRYSDYSKSGSTFAWKAGGIWEFDSGVKLRANYQRAVRAPNIGELFQPAIHSVAAVTHDPCAGGAPAADPKLASICLAQGAPSNSIGVIEEPIFGANETTGGNPDLKFETAKTFTAGIVTQPALIPRLTLRADYYRTSISNAIVNPSPEDVLANCFDTRFNPSLAVTPACTAIRRNPLTGGLEGDATVAGIPVRLTNLGVLETDGVDFGVDYSHNLGFAGLRLALDGNWTHHARFQTTPAAINRECAGFYSVNCASLQPKLSFFERTTLEFRKIALSLLWRYISPMRYEPAQFAADVLAATDPATGEVDPDGVVDPQFRRIRAYHYFDLAARFEPSSKVSIIFTVQNLFNTKPPIVGNTVGDSTFNVGNTYPSTYDVLGRRYAVSVRFHL